MSEQNMINKILGDSKQIVKQFSRINGTSEELNDILCLGFAGMLAYYGQERIDDIYLAFLKTKIVVSDVSIEDLVKRKFKLSSDAVKELVSHGNGTFYDVVGNEFIDKKHKRTYKFNRTIYVQNDGSFDKAKLVRSVVHQMNHVLNSIHNPIVSSQGMLAARMGIALDKLVTRESVDSKVEEAINGLQVEDIMDEIYGFICSDIEDADIRRNLEEMVSCPKEKIVDDEVTEIIRPLYEDVFFQNILIDRRINGRLSGIRAEFESYTDVGCYRELLDACSGITTASSEEEKEQRKACAKQLVKKYLNVTAEDN